MGAQGGARDEGVSIETLIPYPVAEGGARARRAARKRRAARGVYGTCAEEGMRQPQQ